MDTKRHLRIGHLRIGHLRIGHLRMLSIMLPLMAVSNIALPPNAGMVLFGQNAPSVVKPGDTIKIEIPVSQIDQPITRLFLSIPYNTTHVKYVGMTDGEFSGGVLTANDISGGGELSSVNVQWTGEAPAGSEGVLGSISMQLVQTPPGGTLEFVGVNPSAYDSAGVRIPEITYPDGTKSPAVVVEKTGVINVIRRSIKIILRGVLSLGGLNIKGKT